MEFFGLYPKEILRPEEALLDDRAVMHMNPRLKDSGCDERNRRRQHIFWI
jgi:hypothetical protein